MNDPSVPAREEKGDAAPSSQREKAKRIGALLGGAVGLPLLISLFVPGTPLETLTLFAGMVVSVPLARGLPVSLQGRFLTWWAVIGVGIGVTTMALGIVLTDEPYATPQYIHVLLQGKDPYATLSTFTYYRCGWTSSIGQGCQTFLSQTYFTYLPLAMVLFVPGLDYRWFTLALWLGSVYMVRRDPYAFLLLGSPLVGLEAASGFTDFPAIFVLTLGFVGWNGRRSKVAELVGLGIKQFANVAVLLYYIVRKDLVGCAVTLGVTFLILLPFLLWNSTATICMALLYQGTPTCFSGSGTTTNGVASLLNHVNYVLWPVWGMAVFHRDLRRRLTAFVDRSRSLAGVRGVLERAIQLLL